MRDRPSRLDRTLSGFQTTNIISMLLLFLLAATIAIIALILASILWTRQLGNATTVCDGCPGVVDFIETDNSTLGGLVNNTLFLNGECGLQTFLDFPNISFINFRSLSQYVVGQDGCSAFLTPQEAYNQAILDGKGGETGPGAIIIIKPGNYDFTGEQFPILQSGIVFYGLHWAGVYFTSTDTTSGIYTSISPTSLTHVIFYGISFGAINDTNGFVLNISSGRTILDTCYCMDTNFRVYVGKEDSAFFVSYNSKFNPLPPSDFVTAEGPNATVTWKDVRVVNTAGTPGGHMFNLQTAFASLNLLDTVTMFTNYNGIILGPSTNPPVSSANLVRISDMFMEQLDVITFGYLAKQSGSINYIIIGSNILLNGPLITQDTDSTNPGDIINITLLSSQIRTTNATISYDAAVTEISFVNVQITNCNLIVINSDDILTIPAATAGDILNVTLTGSVISTQSAPGGNYLTGPGASFATLNLAGSVSLNGATTATGVTVVTLPFLA